MDVYSSSVQNSRSSMDFFGLPSVVVSEFSQRDRDSIELQLERGRSFIKHPAVIDKENASILREKPKGLTFPPPHIYETFILLV